MPCNVIHDHTCFVNALRKFWLVFNLAYKFYVPTRLIRALLFKQKKLETEPFRVIRKSIWNGLKSSIFVSLYVASFWYFICFFKNWRLKTDKTNIILASFFCSFAILVEPAKRRTELALYMFPRFLELLKTHILVRNGYLKPNSGGDKIVFATAMGICLYCY